MGSKGPWEYLRAIYDRYQKVGQKDKKAILSELCANAGYYRKYAIRLLNGPRPEKRPRPSRQRGVSYDPKTLAVLTVVWEAAGCPWSVRLKALLPSWMPWIRKPFRLRPEIESSCGWSGQICPKDGTCSLHEDRVHCFRMKNITLSADEQLIEQARLLAKSQHKTLNAMFREWLEQFTARSGGAQEFDALMKRLKHVQAGRRFNRDEMNER